MSSLPTESPTVFTTEKPSTALPDLHKDKSTPSTPPRQPSKPQTSKSKTISALKAKQAKRKFRATTLPSPSLNIPLDSFTSFTSHLQNSKRIFALIGAGLSASSGLVTFRGNNRHWRGIEPQDLSSIDEFYRDPVKVWWFFSDRMKRAQEAVPNKGHVALAELARRKEGVFVVNQNIDGLLQRASFPSQQRAQVHGTLFEMKCSKSSSSNNNACTYRTPISYPVTPSLIITSEISNPSVPLPSLDLASLPHCPLCTHLLRPSVVLFGEPTPTAVSEAIYNFTSAGPIDLMLVVGTSAVVLPAARYIPVARNAGARVAFFNLEECVDEPGRVEEGDWMFKGDAAVLLPEVLKGVVGSVGMGEVREDRVRGGLV